MLLNFFQKNKNWCVAIWKQFHTRVSKKFNFDFSSNGGGNGEVFSKKTGSGPKVALKRQKNPSTLLLFSNGKTWSIWFRPLISWFCLSSLMCHLASQCIWSTMSTKAALMSTMQMTFSLNSGLCWGFTSSRKLHPLVWIFSHPFLCQFRLRKFWNLFFTYFGF